MTAKKKPRTVRIDDKEWDTVTKAAQVSGLSHADVMRLVIRMGLSDLEKIAFNIPKYLSDTLGRRVGGGN